MNRLSKTYAEIHDPTYYLVHRNKSKYVYDP